LFENDSSEESHDPSKVNIAISNILTQYKKPSKFDQQSK
jgi:hypothetical protein